MRPDTWGELEGDQHLFAPVVLCNQPQANLHSLIPGGRLDDQGDGIAKVECDYVVIVPGTQSSDEVTVEIE